jgi:Helix-turn-helix domain
MIASFRVLELDRLLLCLPVCGPKWGRRRFPSPLGVVTASSILVGDGVLVLQRHLRSSRLWVFGSGSWPARGTGAAPYRKRGMKARRSSGWDEFLHSDSGSCAKFQSMRKTFRFRLYPTPAQQRKLVQTLRECRGPYNTLLAQCRDAYTETGKSPSLYSQQGRFPELKEVNPALREVHSQVLQNVAVRIDRTY